MPKINEEARKKVEIYWRASPEYPKLSKKDAKMLSEELGVNVRTVYKWISGFTGNVKTKERRPVKKGKRIPKSKTAGTLNDFRQQFDNSVVIPTAIEDGIEKYLSKDGDGLYMRDQDFREACGVGPGQWRRYADDYKHLQVKKDGIIFWGHPKIIDELRKAVNR